MPRAPSSRIIAARSTRPSRVGQRERLDARAATPALRSPAVTISALPPASTRAAAGVCAWRSTTTRSGWRGVATARTVSCGSSCSTVPMPVRIAQARARQRWPSARAASPVIHWLSPLASAVRPSRLAATFMRTHGPAARHPRDEADVELARLVLEQADVDGDAGGAQPRGAVRRLRDWDRPSPRRRARCRRRSRASAHGGVRPCGCTARASRTASRRADRARARARRRAR